MAPPFALLDALLAVTPHVAARGDVVWCDGRGLPPRRTVERIARAAAAAGVVALRVGLARVPLVAEIAARDGRPAGLRPTDARPADESAITHRPGVWRAALDGARLTVVPPGAEGAYLAPVPFAALAACGAAAAAWSPRLAAALADLGLATCGDLAALSAADVELRFGAPGVALRRLARGTPDGAAAAGAAALFPPTAPALPSAALAWSDYELRDAPQLAFVCQRLVARVCRDLAARGEGARRAALRLTLGDGSALERPVRGARASADPAAWGRLARAALDRLGEGALAGGVVGVQFRVDDATGDAAPQGDVFDRGFQSAGAAEAALARVVDGGHGRPVAWVASGHPLPERRVTGHALEGEQAAAALRTAPPRARPPAGRAGGGHLLAPPPGPATPAPTGPPGRPGLRLLPDPPRPGRKPPGQTAVAAAAAPSAPASDALAPERAPEAVASVEALVGDLGFHRLPAPRRVAVVTVARGDHRAPVSYRERTDDVEVPASGDAAVPFPAIPGPGLPWRSGATRGRAGRPLVTVHDAAGPDRVAVGLETGERVARDYWLCATDGGEVVLLYRDVGDVGEDAGPDDGWFLEGWWG